MSKVSLRVDGVMVAVVGVTAGGVWLYSKRKALLNKINPAHSDNIINQAAERIAIRGGWGGYTYDEHLFATIDLLNPFYHGRNDYAKKVWGFGE